MPAWAAYCTSLPATAQRTRPRLPAPLLTCIFSLPAQHVQAHQVACRAVASESVAEEAPPPVIEAPHHYPHFTPFVENMEQVAPRAGGGAGV